MEETMDKKMSVEVDPRFNLIKVIDNLVVPVEYNPDICLATFKKEHYSEFNSYHPDVTDEHFRTTRRLVPGEKFKVKFFQILEGMNSESCLAFLYSENVILTGVRGLFLAWQEAKDVFPVGQWSVSFDERSALWVDPNGSHRIANIFRCSDDISKFNLGLGRFEDGWNDSFCLLCFCECGNSS